MAQWDLPQEVGAFLEWLFAEYPMIGAPGDRVDHFMATHPQAEAMPTELREALGIAQE